VAEQVVVILELPAVAHPFRQLARLLKRLGRAYGIKAVRVAPVARAAGRQPKEE
jgi:hypothetical protein